MSSLGSVEPFVPVPTPREKVAMEYLQSASRILTRQQLQDTVTCSHLLQTEFMVSTFLLFKILKSKQNGGRKEDRPILQGTFNTAYFNKCKKHACQQAVRNKKMYTTLLSIFKEYQRYLNNPIFIKHARACGFLGGYFVFNVVYKSQ